MVLVRRQSTRSPPAPLLLRAMTRTRLVRSTTCSTADWKWVPSRVRSSRSPTALRSSNSDLMPGSVSAEFMCRFPSALARVQFHDDPRHGVSKGPIDGGAVGGCRRRVRGPRGGASVRPVRGPVCRWILVHGGRGHPGDLARAWIVAVREGPLNSANSVRSPGSVHGRRRVCPVGRCVLSGRMRAMLPGGRRPGHGAGPGG